MHRLSSCKNTNKKKMVQIAFGIDTKAKPYRFTSNAIHDVVKWFRFVTNIAFFYYFSGFFSVVVSIKRVILLIFSKRRSYLSFAWFFFFHFIPTEVGFPQENSFSGNWDESTESDVSFVKFKQFNHARSKSCDLTDKIIESLIFWSKILYIAQKKTVDCYE